MPLKSHTSTQHAFMMLVVAVAIVICANGVVANPLSEPVEHRRLGGSLSSLEMSFKNKWGNAFKHQARNIISDDRRENAVSPIRVSLREIQNTVDTGENHWSFKEQANLALPLLESHTLNDVLAIKIINLGKLDVDHTVRMVAQELEFLLLEKWKSGGKRLGDQFKVLKLDEMKTEMELYANPAFTTWMKFAFHLIHGSDPTGLRLHPNYSPGEGEGRDAFRSMLAVLKANMQDKTEFEDLLNVDADTEEEVKLFRNWYHIYDSQWRWYEIVFGD